MVALQGHAHRLVLAELLQDPVLGPAQRLEQHGDVLLALAIQPDADLVALVDLELQPSPPRGDHLAGEDVLVGGLVGALLEVDARRADQLADHDSFGTGDDEGTLVGHQREVADEHGLAFDLAGLVVHELGGHEQRGLIGGVAILALVDGVLGFLKTMIMEAQGHRLVEVLDRADLLEDLLQTRLRVDIGATLSQRSLGFRLPGIAPDQPVE